MRSGSACVVFALLSLVACDKLKKKSADAGTTASTSTATAEPSASAAPSPDDGGADSGAAVTAANEKDIKHFPDEEKAEAESYTVEWPTVDARTEPSTGKVVATLAKGTKATLQARKGRSVLVMFADAKDATKMLLGWVAEDAFVPGTAPPPVVVHTGSGPPKSTGVCSAGLTLLFDADAFCGKTCKVDKDCTGGLTCSGQAKPLSGQGLGAPVSVCSKAKKPTTTTTTATDAGAPKPADAGATVAPPVATTDGGNRALITNPARGLK